VGRVLLHVVASLDLRVDINREEVLKDMDCPHHWRRAVCLYKTVKVCFLNLFPLESRDFKSCNPYMNPNFPPLNNLI